MEKQIHWINDLLKTAEESPVPEVIRSIEGCGRGCAQQSGHIGGMLPFKDEAAACKTHEDYYVFFTSKFPFFNAEDTGDGITIHFHKEKCTCPMAPDVSSPMLCHCTLGHEKAMWGELFGRPVDGEIVESFQRGGNDCVIKLYL